jgi:O-antigen/teichoic acid export membrane protein
VVQEIEQETTGGVRKDFTGLGRFIKDDFFWQSTVVFFASMVGCGFSYLYQIYVGRALGPEGYGVFGSLFAIFYLLSIFSGAIQAGGARFISKYQARGERDKIGSFLYGMMKKSALLGGAGFLVFVLISSGIASFLKIDSSDQVVVLGTVILFSFLMPATMGALQGLQRFYLFAFLGVMVMGLKFVYGFVLVNQGYGVSGALGAVTLATLTTFALSVLFLLPFLRSGRRSNGHNFRELYLYSVPALLVMMCLAFPSNLDVIMAKHFFEGQEAGLYTAASIMGKIVLFLPGAVAAVMFPKAAEMSILGKSTMKLFNRSLIYAGLLSGSAAATFVIFPGLVGTIFGTTYLGAASITGVYVVAMAVFSLNWVVAQYCLAVNDLRYTYLLMAFTAIEFLVLAFLHGDVLQMAEILLVVNLFLFVFSYLYVFFGCGISRRECIGDIDSNAGLQRGAKDIR